MSMADAEQHTTGAIILNCESSAHVFLSCPVG